MPRVISFIVLLAIVLLVGAVFYRVMAQFIVPLFLACVLLVVFQPLHVWIRRRLPRHPRISALGTTVLIVLVVVLPLVWVGWNAFGELHALVWPSGLDAEVAADEPPAALFGVPPPDDERGLTAWLHQVAFELRDKLREATGLTIDDGTVAYVADGVPRVAATVTIIVLRHALGILVGLAIIVIALYYFLADGPEMIRTVQYFSPLDSSYERELLDRFSQVSRAVVLATLLTAAVQGALAGIGFYFALPTGAPIFLLVALTMLTALVPFIGALVVWLPVCGWIYFYGERIVDDEPLHQGDPLTAIVLAAYCAVFVSGIDNVIKPLVLHGQSRLHPLLALLSIIGGVTVLGPVGILVGPMLVSFLQALLAMLRKELDRFGAEGGANEQLASALKPASPQPSANDLPPGAEEQAKRQPAATGSPVQTKPHVAAPAPRRGRRRRGK